eukprot:SAG11_NODE_1797_length_4246_cov_2.922354_7_plen_113_part_00
MAVAGAVTDAVVAEGFNGRPPTVAGEGSPDSREEQPHLQRRRRHGGPISGSAHPGRRRRLLAAAGLLDASGWRSYGTQTPYCLAPLEDKIHLLDIDLDLLGQNLFFWARSDQ